MDKIDDIRLSVEAQHLLVDVGNDCDIEGSGRGTPWVVIQSLGHPQPKTRGQVSNLAVDELSGHDLIRFFGETPPISIGLTPLGRLYVEKYLKG